MAWLGERRVRENVKDFVHVLDERWRGGRRLGNSDNYGLDGHKARHDAVRAWLLAGDLFARGVVLP